MKLLTVKKSPRSQGKPPASCRGYISLEWNCPGHVSTGFWGSTASCILQPGSVSGRETSHTSLLGLTQSRRDKNQGLQTVCPLSSPCLNPSIHLFAGMYPSPEHTGKGLPWGLALGHRTEQGVPFGGNPDLGTYLGLISSSVNQWDRQGSSWEGQGDSL